MAQEIIGGILKSGDEDIDGLVRDVVAELLGQGHKIVGLTQSGGVGELPSRCAGMEVQFIGSDRKIPISQELGGLSTGCTLDQTGLIKAAGILFEAMDDESELLVLSRFGKSEADGGGLIDCASHAVASGIPVLMAVGSKHLESWRDYHGGLGAELKPDREAIANWCHGVLGAN